MGDGIMTEAEVIELQKETLGSVKEYLNNLIPGIETVIIELKGEEKPDTWEYLRMILDGFNWVTEAFNGTVGLLNEKGADFDIASIDASVKKLSDAYGIRNGVSVAECLEGDILQFLNKLKDATSEY